MAAGGSVLVLDGDKLHALDIVRSLGQCGLTVSVGAPARDAIAGASRFAAARLVYPHPARDRDRFIEWLEQELRTGAFRLVMPVTDLTGIPISRELSRLQAYCPIATERFETIQLVSDKRRTLALAARVGVPVPATMAVHREDEIDGCAALLTYPVVCKPMASSVWTPAGYLSPSVFYALDEQALRRSLPPRVRECPIQMDGTVHDARPFGKNVSANAFEVHIVRLHVDESLLIEGSDPARPHIDPTRWRPLIMNFCRFFGLADEVHPSRLANSNFIPALTGRN